MTTRSSIGCESTKSADPFGGPTARHRSPAALLIAVSVAIAVPTLGVGPALGQTPSDRTARDGSDRNEKSKQDDESKESRESRIAKGEITFDDLKFDIEKDEPFERDKLTDLIERLHGKRVKLRGYILPSTLFKETDIEQFVLVRDNQECCFGPGAALFDCVIVEMVPGRTTDFVTRPVTVEGTFKIQEYKYPDGSGHFAVFRIDGMGVR